MDSKIEESTVFGNFVRYIDDRVHTGRVPLYLHDLHARYIKYLADFDDITNKNYTSLDLEKKVLKTFPTAHDQVKEEAP